VLGGYTENPDICLGYHFCDIQSSNIQEPSWISCWAKYRIQLRYEYQIRFGFNFRVLGVSLGERLG